MLVCMMIMPVYMMMNLFNKRTMRSTHIIYHIGRVAQARRAIITRRDRACALNIHTHTHEHIPCIFYVVAPAVVVVVVVECTIGGELINLLFVCPHPLSLASC